MSNRPQVLIFDLATEKTIVREMNDKEYAEFEANEIKEAARQAEADAKAATRQALLNKLGITEEEARLLLGGN